MRVLIKVTLSWLLFLVLLLPTTGSAQQLAMLSGTVTDALTNAPVANAVVTVQAPTFMRFQSGSAVSTITARLDNATDTLYRNYLNYLKDSRPKWATG